MHSSSPPARPDKEGKRPLQDHRNAEEIHRAALILDAHADTPQRFLDVSWNFTDPAGSGHLSEASARAGNLAGELFAIWVEPTQWHGRFAHRALHLIDAVHEQVRRHPHALTLCLTPQDILQARAEGRFAALLSIEGGHALENSLPLLRLYFRLGVRAMTLTWANSNDWAESSTDLRDPPGLTSFGHQVIAEMNRLGMAIDLSHASDRTFWDTLAATHAPVIASHSSARALTDSPRNLTDDMLRALAKQGGVAMVNFYPGFLDDTWRKAWQLLRPERLAAHEALQQQHRGPVPFHLSNRIDRAFANRLSRPPLAALIAHIEHMLQVVGPHHVGIGTDFDGISALPQGIDSAADLPKLTAALVARGYPPATIHQLLGGNLLRVLGEIQAAADPATLYPAGTVPRRSRQTPSSAHPTSA